MTESRTRRRGAARTRVDPGGRAKAVLFCPDCGHESPPDGSWRTRRLEGGSRPAGGEETDRDLALVCPACGAVATVR